MPMPSPRHGLMDAAHAAVVLVDYQSQLMPLIDQGQAVLAQAVHLATLARELGVPVLGTEQNPLKLGPNAHGVRTLCQHTLVKMHFDTCADGLPQALQTLRPEPVREVVIAGCEAHVCLMQTALSLLQAGLRVWVVAPACGARHASDQALAMQRLQQAGATLVSVEMVAFEWLRSCEHAAFRAVLPWVKQGPQPWSSMYQRSQHEAREPSALQALNLNADLALPACVDTLRAPWVTSPAAGITRVLLEREGGEQTTRATSIVAYAPGSRFARHTHPRGEEIWVLHGVFSDERGHHPAGTYLRNPPGSAHAPCSDEGCLLFVKLQQMAADDLLPVVAHAEGPWEAVQGQPGLRTLTLAERPGEHVALWHADAAVVLPPAWLAGGAEVLVLAGCVQHAGQSRPAGHWLRWPVGTALPVQVAAGTRWWAKRGHLAPA